MCMLINKKLGAEGRGVLGKARGGPRCAWLRTPPWAAKLVTWLQVCFQRIDPHYA